MKPLLLSHCCSRARRAHMGLTASGAKPVPPTRCARVVDPIPRLYRATTQCLARSLCSVHPHLRALEGWTWLRQRLRALLGVPRTTRDPDAPRWVLLMEGGRDGGQGSSICPWCLCGGGVLHWCMCVALCAQHAFMGGIFDAACASACATFPCSVEWGHTDSSQGARRAPTLPGSCSFPSPWPSLPVSLLRCTCPRSVSTWQGCPLAWCVACVFLCCALPRWALHGIELFLRGIVRMMHVCETVCLTSLPLLSPLTGLSASAEHVCWFWFRLAPGCASPVQHILPPQLQL
jgi:hypothetical protein